MSRWNPQDFLSGSSSSSERQLRERECRLRPKSAISRSSTGNCCTIESLYTITNPHTRRAVLSLALTKLDRKFTTCSTLGNSVRHRNAPREACHVFRHEYYFHGRIRTCKPRLSSSVTSKKARLQHSFTWADKRRDMAVVSATRSGDGCLIPALRIGSQLTFSARTSHHEATICVKSDAPTTESGKYPAGWSVPLSHVTVFARTGVE